MNDVFPVTSITSEEPLTWRATMYVIFSGSTYPPFAPSECSQDTSMPCATGVAVMFAGAAGASGPVNTVTSAPGLRPVVFEKYTSTMFSPTWVFSRSTVYAAPASGFSMVLKSLWFRNTSALRSSLEGVPSSRATGALKRTVAELSPHGAGTTSRSSVGAGAPSKAPSIRMLSIARSSMSASLMAWKPML